MSALLMAQETPTPALIEQLRGLLAKATPGPWNIRRDADHIGNRRIISFHPAAVAKVYADEPDEDDEKAAANAALIVALRNSAEALLTTLASNQARVAEMEGALERAHGELALGAALCNRGPGGGNNRSAARWAAMCSQLAVNFASADAAARAALKPLGDRAGGGEDG